MDPRLVLGLSLAATIAFIVVDARTPAFRASWSRDRTRLQRNAAFLVANIATMAALNAATHALQRVVPKWIEWPRTSTAWIVAEVVACVVVAEFVNWVSHWVKHRQAWLWTFHAPHHVESHYSINLTLHTHGLEVLVSGALMSALLTLLGFSQLAVDVFTVSYYGVNLYKHCSARLSLGPLDWLIVSPAFHRLHHAIGHDGNFGSVLTVFDVLFRTATFPSTRADVDDAFAKPYGTGSDDDAFGFVAEMRRPFSSASTSKPTSSSSRRSRGVSPLP